jgi:hypothetical protein
MGASGYAPSTSPNGMAWQLLLLVQSLLTKDSGSPLLDPVHDAGITGSFFGPKPKELRKADHATRTALFHHALQVTVVYIPFNIHSNRWVYFKIELATNTTTLHDPLHPLLQTQVEDSKQFLHRLAEGRSSSSKEDNERPPGPSDRSGIACAL